MKTELTTDSDAPVFIKQYNGALVLHHGESVITLFESETIELRNFLNQLELGDKSLVVELVEALEAIYGAIDSSTELTPQVLIMAKQALNKAKGDM